MANEQNLKPIVTLSNEEAKKRGSAGGKKSVEVRRQRKALREIMINFSNGKLKEKQLKKRMQELGFADEDITNKTAVGVGLWKEAVKGNVNAYKEYMALIGEQTPNEININSNVKINPFEGMTTEELRKLLKEDK